MQICKSEDLCICAFSEVGCVQICRSKSAHNLPLKIRKHWPSGQLKAAFSKLFFLLCEKGSAQNRKNVFPFSEGVGLQ